MSKTQLFKALNNPKWKNHYIGKQYTMDGKTVLWRIAYYPIFENGETGEIYGEGRCLIEKPIKNGTDFREMPLRYLTPKAK